MDSYDLAILSLVGYIACDLPCCILPLTSSHQPSSPRNILDLPTSTRSINQIHFAITLAHALGRVTEQKHLHKLRFFIPWPMEDHLCPRLVQPQAACLSCLARPQPLPKPPTRGARCSTRTTTTSATEPASKLSRLSQAAPPKTKPTLRSNYVVQRSAHTTPTRHNTMRHLPPTHDLNLDTFSATLSSAALPAPVSRPCETCPLYSRILKRYAGNLPWAKPINSWRDLPRTRR
jgi:hypothetical protein